MTMGGEVSKLLRPDPQYHTDGWQTVSLTLVDTANRISWPFGCYREPF